MVHHVAADSENIQPTMRDCHWYADPVPSPIFFAHSLNRGNRSSACGSANSGSRVPAPLTLLAIAAQFFDGLGLLPGLLTRIAAFGIVATMLVAVAMVHSAFGFFMNWYGTQKGEGCEYYLLVPAITLFLMIRGAGTFSTDRAIASASTCAPPQSPETR